jgi:DNA replication and repair protein RecF
MTAIRRLNLQDFRSYETLDQRFDGRSVVLTGPNGSGKTNLLEAISLFSPGRGLRSAKLSDIRRQGTASFGAGLALGTAEEPEETRLSVRAAPPQAERREVRVGGQPASGPGAFLDHLAISWLTPAQDRLFVEGASERRRFLDRMTMTQDKAHATASAAYEKAMRQRTAALTGPRAADPRLLSVLETQMAEAGVAVAAARRAMAASLARGYESLREGAFPGAEVALEGLLEEALAAAPASDVEADFAERLARGRRRDAEAGRALEGPHRADLHVTHREKGRPARLCSTGEQKALLIGLVLSGAAAGAARADIPLILLLDEVAAHLDPDRRQALADILDTLGCQAFMTGTDEGLFDAWKGRAQAFRVQNAALSEAG